jgi:hypothetical protein
MNPIRNLVYNLIRNLFGSAHACRFQLWMAVKDSNQTMSEIAKKLGIRVHQAWR